MPVYDLQTSEGAVRITLWPFERNGGLELELLGDLKLSRGKKGADTLGAVGAYVHQRIQGTESVLFDNAHDTWDQILGIVEKYEESHGLDCDKDNLGTE